MNNQELTWTGERLVTSIYNFGAIDHLHRYALALQLTADKDVLDIASGEGYGSYLLSKRSKSVTGVDISAEAISHSTNKYKNPNLKFKVGSADSIPVPDHSIDVVVSFETIEHHDKHREMMSEVKRVLKSEGVLIISSPDKLNYSETPGLNNQYHVKELYREEFKSLLKDYFKNTVFLNQKSVYGSLIAPESGSSLYGEFNGDYNSISTFNELQNPIYNICIASESPVELDLVSYFCGKNSSDYATPGEIEQLKKELNLYKNSRGYKALSFFHAATKPVRRLFSRP